MNLLDELRAFLHHPPHSVPDVVDLGRHRQRFLAALEQREAEGADPAWLRRQHDELGLGFNDFVATLAAELLAEGIAPDEIPELVDTGIALELGLEAQGLTVTRTLILERAAARARGWIFEDFNLPDVGSYAYELQAIRQHGDNAVITAIGRMLLELAGREATKWLLHVETALSTGIHDPWRVDRRTLRELLRRDVILLAPAGRSPDTPELNLDALARLHALDLLSLEEPESLEEPVRYRVTPEGRETLNAVTDDTESPMSILVEALLEDEVRSRLPANHSAPATTATLRQARLVVHELRNTVIPLQVALESIDRTVQAAGISDRIANPRQRLNTGLERLLSFASELDALAHAAGETPDVFDTRSAVREAASIIVAEFGHAPALSLPEQLPPLVGVRSRFVLALLNVLRNAYQAAPAASIEVRLNAEHAGERVLLTIDDNGPGIAPEQRDEVFRDGYSTRTEGSGHGLALARTTIEQDMGGTLSCEDGSSLGGARFVMTVPVYDRRRQ